MKFLNLIAMMAILSLFTGCLDDASVSELSANSISAEEDAPFGTDPVIPVDEGIPVDAEEPPADEPPIIIVDNPPPVESPPVVVEEDPAPVEPPPVVVEEDPAPVEPPPVVVEEDPAPVEPPPVVVEEDPAPVEPPPVVVEEDPAPVEPPPVVVEEDPAPVEPPPVVVEEDPVPPVIVVEEDDPIVIDQEDPTEVESEDEIVSEEEAEEVNDDIDVEDESVDEPPVIVEDDGEDTTDEEDDVVVIDEEEDQKCRKRGNLIQNGSFELSDHRIGLRGKKLTSIVKKDWDVFQALPSTNKKGDSWYTSSGAGIEVQGNFTVTKAPHGRRVVELDSHGGQDTNSTMSQDVFLCRGRHILKFYYYPRTKNLNDNTIEVRINDKLIKSVDMVKDGKWYRIRAPFKVKEKDTYKISFSAAGNDNSLGGLIDKIKLHKKVRRAGVVTTLLSLGDKDNISSPMIRKEIATAIISKSVNFASIKRKPKVLMLKDDFHNGESLDDFVLTEAVLKELYGNANVSVISGEARLADVKGFDVIYIINPGYPMGSAVTADTLREVKRSGRVGIIIAGDDMSRGRNFQLTDLTGLKYKSNGTSSCGMRIDNNRGNKYSVKLRKRFFKKLSPESRVLSYGNDIDHTQIVNKKIRILANAHSPGNCGCRIPTIVGYKLKRHKCPKKK